MPVSDEIKRIIFNELSGTDITQKFVEDAINCAGHVVIRDSVLIGISERLAERIAALEAALESVLKVADRNTDVFNKARAVLKNTQASQ